MTSEQVATLAERLDNVVRGMTTITSQLERMERERLLWQKEHEREIDARLRDYEDRMSVQERWRAYVVGAAAVSVLIFGSGAAWFSIVLR